MICLGSYKFLLILNYSNKFTKCTNVSLAHDRIDIYAFGSQSVCVRGNDNFATTWKFHSVHGYGFLYFIRKGWRRILCYVCSITSYDSYLYIESYPYVLLLYFTEWFYNLISSDYLYLILICRKHHGLCFMLIFVTIYTNCVIAYSRTSCKTTSGWWIILVKYVLIKSKINKN